MDNANTDTVEAMARQYARLGADLFTDLVSIMIDVFGGDLVSGLVFLAIVRAESQSGGRTGGWIGARHLALALDLPFETIRRHVRALRLRGLCKTSGVGVQVPAEVYCPTSAGTGPGSGTPPARS